MEVKPRQQFGMRKQVAVVPTAVPVKRSGHVALLLMGTFAVGGGAYALMPRGNCEPSQPGMAAPSGLECPSRASGVHGGSGGYWSRSSFFGGDPAVNSGATSEGGVTRGGFGAFARAFTAHFSGGG
jgi:hypothetical protein